ncbi:molybdate ABC transporter substrate-binding protein [Paenibacillus sp. J45TS6]|uniref:molybdate ABC transporter substrate-binding protein n=1 Tax=Paenibacillus sp. J45TS6 TaxID=2807196 RepID=UPI001B11552C|nr:molybdate ABC transporter substrate-binding protein [Paenibacillus sp. J45TS6]GIP41833.1 molybdate ABC transporter substrate-binding protein [Paenibacillus sp. J45TS6]
MFKLNKVSYVCFSFLFMMFLAACGSTSSTPDSTFTPTEQESQQSTPESSSTQAEVTELTISAAASLTDALEEIQPIFEANHPEIQLTFNFGSSGALQQQIEQGAPVDLFLSAAEKNMQALIDNNQIMEGYSETLLTNELVLVSANDSEIDITSEVDLTKPEVKIVAIGIPESVPAGSYAKEALEGLGLYDKLLPKVIQAKDVRQVLQYVETGNADAGFVYKTDAILSKVNIVHTVDPELYTPIHYPVGITGASKHKEEAKVFYEFLKSDEAKTIFQKYGFKGL